MKPDSLMSIDETLRNAAVPLDTFPGDFSPLLRKVSNKSFILLGESTHGSHEFYATRAEITRQLITEHQLNAVAIEGDWPSAYRVNRYVRGIGNDRTAREALSDFRRFPLWMWRNHVMLEFVEWLRDHNSGLPAQKQVGFYGLDMYSLYESVAAVIAYLDNLDPEMAKLARERYGCLDLVSNERHYGYGVALGWRASCENEVVQQLVDLQSRGMQVIHTEGQLAADEQFQAEQNARLVKSAESYYRQMFNSRINTWNLRDNHMTDTLDNLYWHLSYQLKHPAKIAVWAHNSHVGDAKATQKSAIDEHNLGQLVRERHTRNAVLVGFTTYTGTVTAASDWDAPAEHKRVLPALPASVEWLFHRTGLRHFYLDMEGDVAEQLNKPILQRAIGVLYLPESERASHYFRCHIPSQFDAVIHYDETSALEPMDPVSEWVQGQQDTYPFGV